MASGERFPCIVCQSLANSIFELHHHQKFCHTSEELSMSVIYLVNYMCLQQNMALKLREASNHSVWPGNTADYHNQKCYIQTLGKADEIRRISELRNDIQKPIDDAPSRSRDQETITVSKTKVKEKQLDRHVASSSGLCQTELQGNVRMNALSSSFVSSWEMELGKVEEINDETFLQSVNGICKDLKEIVKTPDVGMKRRGLSPIIMTGQKCRNKKSNKRQCNDKKDFYSFDPASCYKNVKKAYHRNQDSKFWDDAIADYSSKNNGAPVKLASFAQTFQHLKQRIIKFPNETNSFNGDETFQGSVDQTFPLHKENTILQKALITADYKHRANEKISMLDSNFRNNSSEQPGFLGTRNYVGMSDVDEKIKTIV